MGDDPVDPGQQSLRIDKWLWCVRFYKSRALAAAAVAGGKVHVNGERVKPARIPRIGDLLRITQGASERSVVIRAIPTRRGPPAEAQACYEETAESIAKGLKLREQHALAGALVPRPAKRPDKRDRRRLLKLHRQL